MSGALNTLLTIGGIGLAGWYLWTQTDFREFISTIGKRSPIVSTPPPRGRAPSSSPPPTRGGGGGGAAGPISTSGTCVGTPLTRDTGNGREEWESKNVPWDAYEVTWCGTFSTDELTFKLYGPSHSGSACCWCVMHVYPDGKMVAGGEGPHPSSNCEHASSSKGGGGKATCYKATIEPGPIQKGYAWINGAWQLRAEYKGPCGCSKKSSTKTGNTLMVRNDGNAKTTCASVRGLSGANYARSFYASSSNYSGNMQYLQKPRYSTLYNGGKYIFNPSC